MILVRQVLHALFEIGCQETLSNIETLKLGNGIELLLTFLTGTLKRLILLLYPLYFSFDLLLPLCLLSLPLFVVTLLVLPDLVKFMLFLDLKRGLLERLAQQHVQNRLHFHVVVKELVVLDLRNFVDAGLLWNVFWRRRFRLKHVSLQFHFCLVWFHFALLS